MISPRPLMLCCALVSGTGKTARTKPPALQVSSIKTTVKERASNEC
jgi:hypothetical protein